MDEDFRLTDKSIEHWLNDTIPWKVAQKRRVDHVFPGNSNKSNFDEGEFKRELSDLIIFTPVEDAPFIAWALNYLVDSKVVIGPSTLNGNMYGLFAKKKIAKGQAITSYGGIVFEGKVGDDEEYVIDIKKPYHIDGRIGFSIVDAGRWANGFPWSKETRPFEKLQNNAKGMHHPSKLTAVLEATRDIYPGEEIFLDYGTKYNWEAIYPNEPELEYWLNREI